ncbi:MAG: SH3 domain-containing protein [Dehalococcoidia bacterium]|nr:SH3 domain-containing protein [Dehalococcoidia bacterium]
MRTAFIVAAFALLLGGCSGDDQEPTATPSSTGTAASPTSAPDRTPDATFLEAVRSPLKKSAHKAGELLREDTGVAFMDTASGAVEFWSLVDPAGAQEWPQLSPTGDGELLVLHRGNSPVRHYVVRRDSGAAYELKGGWAPDASIGFGHVIGAWKGTDHATLGLLDVASGTMTQTAITRDARSNSSQASSPDGTVFVVGNGSEFVLVNSKTGAQKLVKDGLYNHLVSPLTHGKGFAIGPEGPGEPFNFDWNGDPLPGGNYFNLSPDGLLRAIPESPGSVLSLGLGAFPVVDTVTIVDAATGVPRVRFLGASFHGWGADSRTLMVGDEDGGERIIDMDGREIARVPYPGLVQGGTQFSPVDASIAITNRAIVNFRTGRRFELVVGDGISTSGRWNADGTEVAFWIFLTPGKDGGVAVQLLPLKFETAPFPAALHLNVAADDCLNLREGPDPDAPIITCMAPGTRLTFEPVLLTRNPKEPPSEFIGQRQLGDSIVWLHVGDGAERTGWVDASYVGWGD